MKVKVDLLAGGYGEEDKLALRIFAESEREYESVLRVLSELKRRGITVKRLIDVEEKCRGWYVELPYGEVDEELDLPPEHPFPRFMGGSETIELNIEELKALKEMIEKFLEDIIRQWRESRHGEGNDMPVLWKPYDEDQGGWSSSHL